MAYRLKNYDVRFVFAPQAVGYHYANRSFQSWMATPYAYGRNDVIFTQKKGQTWLLPVVFREFHTRHPFIQQLVRRLLDRSHASKWVIKGLKMSAELGQKMRVPRMSRMAYSCIFNLKYYQGITDELGGRSLFLAGLDTNL